MIFRGYQPTDLEAIAAVFRDAVIGTGSSAYDTQQVAIWSAFANDLDDFKDRLSQGLTIVAVENEITTSQGNLLHVAAFGQLNPPDHIALLYTASPFARHGCATEIYHRLEAAAIAQGTTRLQTEASRIAKHFFLKMGFHVVEVEQAVRCGVEFERFCMEKIIWSEGQPD